MPVVWKDILRTGTYRTPSGEVHKFTSQDVRSAFHNGRAMLRSSIPIAPAGVWEHDWYAVPEKLSAFLSRIGPDRDRRAAEAKNAFGWAKDFKITFEPDAKSGGKLAPVLWALLNAPDQRDLEQLEKTRYVSPRVDWGFRDALGRTWDGCSVVHIAATHSPVQIDQRPVMLGRPASLKTVFLGGATMTDAKDDPPKKGDATDTSGGDMTARLKAICEMMDWPVSDAAKTPDDVLLIMESHAQKGGNDPTDPDDTDPNSNPDTDDVTPAGGLNAAMLSAMTPEQRAAVEGLQKRNEVVEKRDRGELLKRFREIEGPAGEHQIFGGKTVQRLKDLERRLTGVNLSYNPESGSLITNGVMRELEALEIAVRAKAGTKTGKSTKVRAVDLSGVGGIGPGPTPPPQKPGDPGYEEAVAEATRRALERVTPRK